MTCLVTFLKCILLAHSVLGGMIRPIQNVNRMSKNKLNVFRIINGNQAIPHTKPFAVYLRVYIGQDKYRCGGSIVDEYNIVTAAHCLNGAKKVLVKAGRHDIKARYERGAQTLISHNYTMHPGFTTEKSKIRSRDDIAIVHLPQPLQMSNTVGRISMATTEPAPGTWLESVGWGYKTVGTYSSTLLTGSNQVVDDNSDLVAKTLEGLDKKKYLCVDTSTGQLTCKGDSGGPLVDSLGAQLVGVSSFGRKGCSTTAPSCFASVPYYYKWIMEHLKKA